jgi:hypothetical protein
MERHELAIAISKFDRKVRMTMRTQIAIAGLVSMLLAALPMFAVHAEDMDDAERTKQIHNGPPSATLDFEGQQFRLLLGGGSGKGVLHFKGKDYPFTAKGASVGGVGYVEAKGTGNVYFLEKLEDFPGTYGAITAGAALVKGAGASSWQNQKRVVLILKSESKGAALTMGMAAINVSLTPQ